MSIITIVLFFVYLFGLGFAVSYFFKKLDNPFEQFFLNLGLGMALLPIVVVILNLFHIPLDWKILLALSLIFPAIAAYKKISSKNTEKQGESLWFANLKQNFKLTKSNLALLIVLLITLVSLYTYATGAFSYPYFEDEDPWGHAVGVKYVALEKNAYDPELTRDGFSIDPALSYIDPYPPAYDVFLGILHQTSSNLPWTMKFFNALLISLGFIFFYFFAKQFIGNRNKALFATFVLAAIPCYLSHFVWAHAMIITIIFPTLYAFEKIREDKRWVYPALLFVASIWVTQNFSQPIKITTMLVIYVIVRSIVTKKFAKYETTAIAGGILLSFTWWGVMIKKYTLAGFIRYYTGGSVLLTETTAQVTQASTSFLANLGGKFVSLLGSLTSSGGSGSRAYSIADFVIAQKTNMINNPIGVGIVLSILTLIGVVYVLWHYKTRLVTEKNAWLCISLFWLVFTFWGVNGQTFPISVARGPFRVWMLMAIPIALIATEGLYFLKSFFAKPKTLRYVVVALVIVGILFTSFQYKYVHNTIPWPTSGSFTNQQQPFLYGQWFETLPADTKVFLYAPRDKLVIGYGGFTCDWCQYLHDFRSDILNKDAQQLHAFLVEHEYEFLVINPQMDFKYLSSRFGEEEAQQLLPQRYQEIIESGLFEPVHEGGQDFVALRVR